MKKLILSLVLAAITLPAMAILGNTPQEKLTNALATLDAFGIAPIVVSDDLGLSHEFYAVDNTTETEALSWVYELQNKIVGGDFFLQQAGATFVADNSQGVVDGRYTITVNTNGYEEPGSVAREFTIQLSQGTLSHYLFLADENYQGSRQVRVDKPYSYYYNDMAPWRAQFGWLDDDVFLAAVQAAYENGAYSTGYKDMVEQLWDTLIDGVDFLNRESDSLDIGNEVAAAIQHKAGGLKVVIKDIGLQTAASAIVRSAVPTCNGGLINMSLNTPCTEIVHKLVSISDQLSGNIHTPISYEYQGKTWKHVSPGSNMLTATYTQPNGLVVTSTQALSNIYHKTGFVTVDAVYNTTVYNEALSDISDIADAYIFLTEADFTFGDLVE